MIIIDILNKFIGRPLFLAIQGCKAEFMNRITIKGSLVTLDNSVIAVDPYRPIIVRDGKGKDLPVKLLLALYRSIELDDTLHGNGYTVRVLSVSNVKSRGTALDLAGKEGKVYPVSRDEKGVIEDAANKLIELLKLLVAKCRSSESNRIVRFRQWTLYCYTSCPGFVDPFN